MYQMGDDIMGHIDGLVKGQQDIKTEVISLRSGMRWHETYFEALGLGAAT